MLRNPLADPYVLGVSSGAAVGAILAYMIEPHLGLAPDVAVLLTPLGAFMGALVTIAGVYLLGQRDGEIDSTTLLLGGIITASFLNALIMLLLNLISERDHGGMSFWLMGDLSTPLQSNLQWIIRVGFLLAGWRDEQPMGDEEDFSLSDLIEDQGAEVPDDAATRSMLHEAVRDALATLPKREREVMELRFGLEDGRVRTLEEVGKAFGVTRERIRQIEAKTLAKLRHPNAAQPLRDFLDEV